MVNNVTILGAGLAGMAVAYRLSQKNIPFTVYEKESTYGGLCQKMDIEGFTFDRFVHFSFTEDPEVKKMFLDSAKEYTPHKPIASNYYHKYWLAHPAQNNLYPLPKNEQDMILEGFRNRPNTESPHDYQEWIDCAFGKPFASRFSAPYTRKYWTVEPEKLETKWAGPRVLKSDLSEIEEGCSRNSPSTKFYTKEMRYPLKGGFQAFMDEWASPIPVTYNHTLISCDNIKKTLTFSNNQTVSYTNIISTLPLPYLINIMTEVPDNVREAAKKIFATKGYTVSIGLKGELKKKHLWFYIYDEDILFARVYSPSMKSPNNAPEGYSSLQVEFYYSDLRPLDKSADELVSHALDNLEKMDVLDKNQVIFAKAHHFEYANVIFTHDIYNSRSIIHSWLQTQGISVAGRFGEWGYLWSGDAVRSGLDAADSIIKKLKG